MTKILKSRIVLALIMTLFTSLMASSLVEASPTKLESLYIGNGSYVSVRHVDILTEESGTYFTYTLIFNNYSSKTLSLLDYWVKLKTNSGQVLKTQLVTKDKTKNNVPAKGAVELTYYSKVTQGAKLSDFQIQMIRWDFDAPNYERFIGSIKIPGTYTNSATPFEPKYVVINNSKLKSAIKGVTYTKDERFYHLSLSFLLENVGNRSISLDSLKFMILSNNNAMYSVDDESLKDIKIQSKERQIVTIKSSIPVNAYNNNLRLVITQLEETDKINVPLASFKMPSAKPEVAAVAETVEYEASHKVSINSTELTTLLSSAIIIPEGNSGKLYLTFDINNNSNKEFNLTNTEYQLVHSKNVQVLKLEESNLTTLPAKGNTVLNLSTELDKLDSIKDLSMQFKYKDETSTKVVGTYKIPTVERLSSASNIIEYNALHLQIGNVQRLPWQSQDSLAVELQLTNLSSKAVKQPNLVMDLYSDNVKLTDESLSFLAVEPNVQLQSNQNGAIYAYTQVPYNTKLGQIRAVIYEKVGDQKKLVGQLSSLIRNQYGASNSSKLNFQLAGLKSTAEVGQIMLEEGKGQDRIYVEVKVDSAELRELAPPQFIMYVQTESNEVFPLVVSKTKALLGAKDSMLMHAWGTVPKGVADKELKLLIGYGVKDNKIISGEESADGVVNVRMLKASTKPLLVKNELKELLFAGHTMNIYDLQTYLNTDGSSVNGINLDLKYDLEKSIDYRHLPDDLSLVFEFQNLDKLNRVFTKEIFLTDKEDADYIVEGLAVKKSILFMDTNLTSKLEKYTDFNLKIYLKAGNQKFLMASRDMKWFVNNP
ncbi:hypothetical protein [Paenibacillus sp. 1P07SE]|uniref:hypothetical protein n=1 Tax=Paenibacillus sp. 1P07SE TaxID=3132209 RepID=UPI0039A4BB76